MPTSTPVVDDGLGLHVGAPTAYCRYAPHRRRWLRELGTWLAFRSISALAEHRPDLAAAADWLASHLAQLGLQHVRVLDGPAGGAPSVYADWLHAPGKPTLLLYGHFDVQPVGPLGEWRTPPFVATLRKAAIYARGASDDKGQLFIQLKALESYLATQRRLPLNL